ncbi:polysaccharide biosynthesis tyrosine autokinase [Planktothrix sp. FACHB-1365]|uniref:GumC family protein n=1 Tax=Planktothrix sp. FACHB-1365 TaxID=2692855 RepID=UPI00168536ED|nr:polysaccharide biosynthesis tyrosine autokinase [Planktothrix sp. FACHB-1365]MBD2482366.1 polysaccharide biosynthesis tyrosine autokinase [Planktothrix sp. FACHB-1365]
MEPQDYPEDIDLIKYWLILKRHWLPAAGVACIAIMFSLYSAINTEKTFAAFGKLRLKRLSTTSALVTDAGEKISTLDTLNSKDTPLDTEAEVIRSAPIVEQVIKELNLKDKEGEPLTYEKVSYKLGVSTIRGTDILGISYESPNPKEAEAIVNKVMELYIKNNILVNRSEAAAARTFISAQLPKKEQELQDAEAGLRNFKEKYNIVNLEEEVKLVVSTIEQLDTQIEQTQVSLDTVTGQIEELQKKLGSSSEDALARSTLSSSSGVQQVLTKLQEVEDQLALLRTRFLDTSPEIIALENERDALKALLDQRIQTSLGGQKLPSGGLQNGTLEQTLTQQLVTFESQKEGLTQQLASLLTARQKQKERALLLPQLEQTQRQLTRQLMDAQNTYEILTNRLQQVRIAENQNVGNAQIISQAIVGKNPVSGSKKTVVIMGVVVGGMLYVVISFLFEILDPSIKTLKEIRNLFSRYTLLGIIPAPQKKVRWTGIKIERITSELPVKDEPHSLISESYRMLQANLNFISPDRELKVVAVTSIVAKEGKSKVSANLAVAIAQLGKRVLLIDADLRQPRQHHIWDLTDELNPKGLSDVIVSQAEWEWAVRTVMPNLDVLPSGAIPPNSLALLGSKRMNFLVEEFRKNYDFVIFDTPSLLLVADALTLSKVTDGILLVIRPGNIDTISATAAREQLIKSSQTVLGIVVNDLNSKNEPDSYFRHAKVYSNEGKKSQKRLSLKNKRLKAMK